MKRNYQKPDIFYEDFALSSNIANSCSLANYSTTCTIHGTHSSMTGSCMFIVPGFNFFSGEFASPCDGSPQDFDPNNACYDVPFDDARMFAS